MDVLNSYRGLSIDCEEVVAKMLPELSRNSIRSIISKHGQNIMKSFFYKFSNRADTIVKK